MNGEVKVRGQDDRCCGIFYLKYVLYIFNFIFWLSGMAFVAVGLWTLLAKIDYASLLPTNTYLATTYLIVATGGFIILIGIIGCCGTCTENVFCLMLFAGVLLLVFLLEVVIGVLAYMYEARVHMELTRHLNNTMLHNYQLDEQRTNAIDHMQQAFHCCGAASYEDWKYSRWLKGNPTINNTAPDSCCKTVMPKCAIRDHPSNIFYDGCIDSLCRYLQEHLIIMGAIGLGVSCLQIFGIIFACCLAKKIKEHRKRQKSHW